ncbi:MAG: chromate transporter [Christensenellaceae bacterium]|jgi:chromate transporter|nr:chromate transporter [Christensenellaceae bacterium]
MTLFFACLNLLYVFFKIGLVGFGGGYAMLSMILVEGQALGVSAAQMADLNALDMVVPGPIALNAATYVGYLHAGFWGSLAATIGVSLPSLLIVTLILRFMAKYKENHILEACLSGIRPAAVGLIAAAAWTIASGILFNEGKSLLTLLSDPLGSISFLLGGIFLVTAVLNIRFKVNPILLTVVAGVIGAVFLR